MVIWIISALFVCFFLFDVSPFLICHHSDLCLIPISQWRFIIIMAQSVRMYRTETWALKRKAELFLTRT